MCPKLSEKPKRSYKNVTFSVNMDVIKHIWYDFVGYFLGLEMLKIFQYK